MAERELALPLDVLKGSHRIAEILVNLPAQVLLHCTPDQEQAGRRKAGGDRKHGEKKFCP